MSINLNAILVNQMLLTQLIEYIQLYKNFETSYDQILQPQKRLVIRRLLEATMGRMIELKHELVKHQLNYIQFHEPVLKVKQGRCTTWALSLSGHGTDGRPPSESKKLNRSRALAPFERLCAIFSWLVGHES